MSLLHGVYPDKRREHLESVISSWKKHYSDHNVAVKQWKSDLNVYRESTYISCWNRASSMSLAMWEMYGGTEASLEVPHPNTSGFSLSLNPEVDDAKSIVDFIETVYVHPMLEEDSLVVHSVSEINKRFDAGNIRVVADKIEALGSDITLPESP